MKMGGSSSTSTPTGNGGSDCLNLQFTTPLTSPSPDVVGNLSQGQQLFVDLNEDGTPIVLTGERETVGTITGPHQDDIKECIDEGFNYIATVEDIAGGEIIIEVEPEQ
jgi:hypothetical protein